MSEVLLITDTTKSACVYRYVNDMGETFDEAHHHVQASDPPDRTFLEACSLHISGSDKWSISRSGLIFDTRLLPLNSRIISALFRAYFTVYHQAQVGQFLHLVKPIGNYPSDPIVITDYNIAKISANIVGSMSGDLLIGIPSYQDIEITDLSVITKAGYTKFYGVHSQDLADTYDNVDNLHPHGFLMDGSNSAHPPQLEITYDLVVDNAPPTTFHLPFL